MGERQVTEAEVLNAVLDDRLEDLYTAIPGRVHTFNRSSQVADVIPQVWPQGEELPVLPRVPVAFPRGSQQGLIFDLDEGDPGLLVICNADISLWRQQGEPGAAADVGRHNLQSAVFFPGLHAVEDEFGSLPDGTTVLYGGDVRLGDETATEHVLHGNAHNTALKTWADAVATAVADPTLTTATGVFKTAVDLAISSQVKVK